MPLVSFLNFQVGMACKVRKGIILITVGHFLAIHDSLGPAPWKEITGNENPGSGPPTHVCSKDRQISRRTDALVRDDRCIRYKPRYRNAALRVYGPLRYCNQPGIRRSHPNHLSQNRCIHRPTPARQGRGVQTRPSARILVGSRSIELATMLLLSR
jgi:hypothetical protein